MADCDLLLNGIPRDCYGSIGGLAELWIGDRSLVLPVADDTERAPILSAINFAEGATLPVFKRYWFKTENANFTIGNSSNGAFITTLTAIFEKLSADKALEWEELKKDGACALAKDGNGKRWFLGFDNSLRLDRDNTTGQTGDSRDDDNQYSFALIDYSIRHPYEVPASVYDAAVNPTVTEPARAKVASVVTVEEAKAKKATKETI